MSEIFTNKRTTKLSKLVLIAEDEEEIASVLSDYLIKDAFETKWVENGNEMIPFIKKHNPILLLLDILRPVMNGIDRAYPKVEGSKVIPYCLNLDYAD